jgi:predicted acylesterase/phospholipase RssA
MEEVLYFVATPTPAVVRATQSGLENAARHLSPLIARGVRFHVETNAARARERLQARGAYALVVDARFEPPAQGESQAQGLLRALFDEHDISGPIGREQTWLVVRPDAPGTALAFEAGRARIAGALAVGHDDAAWREIWSRIEATIRRKGDGRIAICLAGGGIEGLFYELGVLRALQYFLPSFPLQEVDIICGISAGAIIGSFMANGIGLDDIVAGLQSGKGKLDRIGRRAIFDPNYKEVLQRVGNSALGLLRGKSSLLQSLYRLAPTGVFAGEGLLRYLERQFNKPGMVDRFTDTKHRLFVGATDMDTAEHVVFGSPGWDHVAIHLAVRASSALTPFYAPQRIEGRWYMDGAFSRTTNVRTAVENGATLLLVVDPLVPMVGPYPGYVAGKGGIMVGMQGLKSLIHGRFDRAVHMMRAMYPEVAFHLFQPDGATMRVMSGSPMKFFYRTEIEEIAFRETIRAIRQQRFESLHNDFARHGVLFTDPEADLGTIKRDMLDEASEVQVA